MAPQAPVPSRWYVIQCKPREDRRAWENLDRQGYECYCPTLSIERVRRRRRIETCEFLFPGYLFIRLDTLTDNWYPIRSTRGVLQIVRFSGLPLPIADEVVALIQLRCEGAPIRIPYLNPGDRVRVTEGCFSAVEAIFIAPDGNERVLLLMDILHREQTVSFPIESVLRVAQAS